MATQEPSPSWASDRKDLIVYLRRLILTIVVIALTLLLWELKIVFLLVFIAILVSVGLLSVTRLVQRLTGLGHRASLTIGGLSTLALLILAVVLIWPLFAGQFADLGTLLTTSIANIEADTGVDVPDTFQEFTKSLRGSGGQVVSGIVSVAGTVVSVLAGVLLILGAGIYLAAEPKSYKYGVVLLFPKSWRPKMTEALEKSGEAIHLWLHAQLLSMLAVGILTGLGTWIIGLPSPLALGLIAGITDFIPIIGPWIGAIPGVLVALGEGWTTTLWTVLLYVVVQQLESNVITPLAQRQVASLPPVILVFSFVALGLLFGFLGLFIAAPLTVAVYILVREFYVGDLLDTPAGSGTTPSGPSPPAEANSAPPQS